MSYNKGQNTTILSFFKVFYDLKFLLFFALSQVLLNTLQTCRQFQKFWYTCLCQTVNIKNKNNKGKFKYSFFLKRPALLEIKNIKV